MKHSPRTPADSEISPARVFVESVLVELPVEAQLPSSADLLTSISSMQGRLVASPHVIAQLDTTTTTKIERILPPGATPEPGIFWTGTTVLPRLAEPDLVLEMDIEVQTAEPKKGMQASEVHLGTHLHNVFAARERQTVMLNAPVPGYARGILLVALTPYLIRSQRDLRDIFECKMQRRAAQRAAAAQ